MYKVSISGKELGYVENIEALNETVVESVAQSAKNIDNVEIKNNPEYELKLVDRKLETNEDEIVTTIKQDVDITYKYYEIALNDNCVENVNTIEEAEELVNSIKENYTNEQLDLSIIEKYTNNQEEIEIVEDIEVAQNDIQTKIEEQEKIKQEEERLNRLPSINGIKLAQTPVSGTITSRYGVSSRIRSSNHTGIDIATATGTPIKVVADGVVTCASYNGSYGNLVKVDHGNNVETWYAHTSKMYVSVGQNVVAGDVIAAVGSTGNSTGAHLHLEIRLNGAHINPQNYLYN